MTTFDQIIHFDKAAEDNFYQLLNCDPSATVDQIQAEFRNLAVKYHPDKNIENPEAERTFKLLQKARETLTDPEKRLQYDKWLSSGLAIPYVQWCSSTNTYSTMMHWASPQTQGRMLESTAEGAPGSSKSRRSSDFVTSKWTTEGWKSDKSEVLRKFRNYEI